MKLAPTKKRPDNVIDITDKYKKKKSSIFSAKGMLCILLVAIAVFAYFFYKKFDDYRDKAVY